MQAVKSGIFYYAPAVILGLGAFMATFDVTAVSLALPEIAKSLALDGAQYVWVANAYNLAFAVMLIAAGAIADRHGHRRALLLGTATFVAASMICGFALSFEILILGRVMQGIAAAFMVCGGYALVGSQYPDKESRVQAFGIIGTIAGSAMAVGPGLGGLITAHFGWHIVFLVKVPFCIAILAGTLLLVSDPNEPRREARIDIRGSIVFGMLLFTMTWLLLNGPVFPGAEIALSFWIGAILLLFALFVRIELGQPHPAVDLSLFANTIFAGLALVPLILAICYWSLVLFIPQFLTESLGLPLEKVTYLMLCFTVPMFLVPMLSVGIAKTWRQSSFFCVGLILVGIGCLGLSASAMASDPRIAILAMIVAGSGAAAIQTQVSGALIASAPIEKAGSVSAVMTVLRQGGFAIGVAMLSAILTLQDTMPALPFPPFAGLFLICAAVAGIGAAITYLLLQHRESRNQS
ncbi:MFS transporter [Leisingera daeponensis]|uniref:MFS transporter n=1 Tax=Leisingera daeponensis TaxID=405746 RepID=UPI00040E94E7|nr:MFS transporter [Leisingera daeponensis]